MIDESLGKDTKIKKALKGLSVNARLDWTKAERKYEIVNFKRKLNTYVYDLKVTTILKKVVVNRNIIDMEVKRKDEQRRKIL